MKQFQRYLPGLLALLLAAGGILWLQWRMDQIPGAGPAPVLTGPSPVQAETLDGLTMEVEQVEGTSFTILFENQSDVPYEFGWACGLEKEREGVWYSLERREDLAFTAEAYTIPAWDTLEWREDVDYYARNLDEGRYRLLKTVIAPGAPGDQSRFHVISAEFTIEK